MVTYTWHGDDRYYSTVVDRYYRQAPTLLHLRVQALGFWVVIGAIVLLSEPDIAMRAVWFAILTVFCLIFPYIVKRGIVLKYRLRPTFGAETTFKMTHADVQVTGPGSGHFPWTVYRRAVAFPDGVMLVRRGGIRWLPSDALKEGTYAEAVELVQSHLPLRVLP
jgi:hypothetical protein